MAFPLTNTSIEISVSQLAEQYQQQVDAFCLYADRLAEQQDMEDIHQLRVSIKNIRAYLLLFELCSRRLFSKEAHFDLLANLFKRAGQVREAQINLGLIKGIVQAKHFYDFLLRQQEKHSTRLSSEVAKFDKTSFESLNSALFEQMQQWDADYINLIIERFLREKWSEAIETMQGKRNVKTLHNLRIELKVIREILGILNTFRDSEAISDTYEHLKLLHGKIGDWHDREVLQLTMGRYLQNNKDKNLRRFQESFIKKTKTCRNKLWRKVEMLFE